MGTGMWGNRDGMGWGTGRVGDRDGRFVGDG